MEIRDVGKSSDSRVVGQRGTMVPRVATVEGRQSLANRSCRRLAASVIVSSVVVIMVGNSWAADNRPRGSYETTCRTIEVVGKQLSASCKNMGGKLTPSSLANFDQCIGDIHNYNGQLRCNLGSIPPSGSYSETCRFIFASGTTLNANCKNASGKWVAQTFLSNFNQCIGDINNYDGQLHCNLNSTPPSGPYTETCRFIFTTGERLTANCKDAQGEWAAQTFLSNFDRCVGSIVNVNGLLRCSAVEAPHSIAASSIQSQTK